MYDQLKSLKLGLFKSIFLFLLTIGVLPTVIDARQLECSYDYATHKTVLKISETDNELGDLEYTFHHELGLGGNDMWIFDEKPPTEAKKSSEPYAKMWGDLFRGSDKYFPDVVYINFETAKFHQIQAIDGYLKNAEKLPHGYIESNRMLEVPVILWDCKRLD